MNEQELQYADEIVRGMARNKALQGLDGDPDRAGQAIKLENSTGVDSQAIYGDENFVKNYKGFLTQRMLDRNPGLEDYINSHPMAAIVSKDDWSKMADFYDNLDYWIGTSKYVKPAKAWIGAIHGYIEGIDRVMGPPLTQPSKEDIEKWHPYAIEAFKGLAAPAETGLRLLSALAVEGPRGAGRGAALGAGASEERAREIGEAIAKPIEYLMSPEFLALQVSLAPAFPPAAAGAAITGAGILAQKLASMTKIGGPYLRGGELPPPGVHGVWDAVQRADVEQKLEAYDALQKSIDKTKTKDTSPDMMARAIELRTKEDISFPFATIQKLYGEKIPEIGDNILGDIPGFTKQYEQAISTGSNIQIPLSEWTTKVPSEVIKALHDDIPFPPNDLSLNDVKRFKKLEEAISELLEPEAAEPLLPPEPPLERLSRLKTEYQDRLATHGAIEHVQTPEGNLLQSLAAVTGKTIEADKVSNAMRWAFLNGRPDIVERALEVSRLSDPELFARLGTELADLNKYRDAQLAIETEMDNRPLFKSPEQELGLLGILPKGREQRYLKLIQKDIDKANENILSQAIKDEKKRQTPEWNLHYAQEYEQALAELKERPDFRVSAFFRDGIIGDEKIGYLPKLDPKFFTKDELEVLPKAWFRQRDGFAPDDIARFFGYKSGQEMKNAMIRFEAEKGTGRPQTMMDHLARQETERRMKEKYGDLDENVLKVARENEISLEKFDLHHEETLLLGAKLGQQLPYTKEGFRNQAHLAFNETISGQVSLIRVVRAIAKSNRIAQDYWLKGDVAGAYVERQQTLRLEALAEHAKKFEKEREIYFKERKRTSKREIDNIDQEYLNWIHHIHNRTGPEVRSPVDLTTEIMAHKATTLADFLKEKSGEAWLPEGYKELEIELNPQIPVWERLIDPNGWNGDISKATVGEFRAIDSSIKALVKAGRDELAGVLRGKAFDRKKVLDKMMVGFQSTMIDKLPPVGDLSRWQQFSQVVHHMKAGLLQMQYIWGRLDQNPYGGVFYDHFTQPFTQAGNEFRLLIGEYGVKLNKIKQKTSEGVDLKSRSIPNDVLFEPFNGLPEEAGPFLQDRYLGDGYLTRAQLRAIMLNISDSGKRGNLSKLAKGYGADPQAILDLVNKHATPKDWEYVQGIWKLFEEIQDKDDIISRNMTGVALQRLPFDRVKTNLPRGPNMPLVEIDGGYYPMIYNQTRGGGKKGGKIDPNLPSGVRVLTDRGWERERTNYNGPVDLSLGNIEGQLSRRLRNIAFREVLTESQWFFNNGRFRDAMTRHLGQEYTDLLIPYLRDIAGTRATRPKLIQAAEHVFSWFTQNAVTTFVGLNPGTMMKHNLTAFFQSFKEIKDKRYLVSAVHDMFTGVENIVTKNHEFAGDISAEIKGRRPNWMEALGGETDVISGKRTLRSISSRAVAWPIATMDQGISKWLWYAKYREVMDELMPTASSFEEARASAINQADIAVIRTHGSTAITSRPAYMREPLMKPFVALYGFFNHALNRMYEVSWEARKHRDLETGEAKRADISHIASQLFWALVPAALVEEIVTPLFDKEGRSFVTRFLMSLGFPVTSSIPGIRELAHGLFTDHAPAFGILSGSGKAVVDLSRQLKKGVNADKFGDQLMAANTFLGVLTGMGFFAQQIGRWEKFAYNLYTHRDRPEGFWGWARGLRYGSSKERRRH